jgi:H2-forming N5,N10-methylenetetrahydromethanopterin dehydrogenase-like enzyme
MNTDLNYHRENNTTVGKKIRKRLKLSKETSKSIFGLMCDVFAKHARKDTEVIVIKTFVRVIQSHFQPGDRIALLPNEMFQKIELENHMGEKEHIKLKEKLKGFPLNPHDLESI